VTTGRGASVPRLAPGHAVVQRILAAKRQAARHLGHDLNDPPYDITAVACGCAIEQVTDRGTDLCLCVVFIVEMKLI